MDEDRLCEAKQCARRPLHRPCGHRSGAWSMVTLMLAVSLCLCLMGCGPASGFTSATATAVVMTAPPATPFVTPTFRVPNSFTTALPTITPPGPTPTNTPTPAATPYEGTASAVITIDNVTLSIHTPFLPNPTFGVASPGNAQQVADSSSFNPFRSLQIVVAPFGFVPGTESDPNNPLPAARHGGADAYRARLREYKVQAGGNPQPGATALLFGQRVTGDVSLLQRRLTYNEPKPTLYVEWVVEAGPRLWIVRIVKQLPDGTTDLSGEQDFLRSLQSLTISSDNLENPSTLQSEPARGTEEAPKGSEPPTPSATFTPQKSGMHGQAESPDTLFAPPWWNGDICDDTHYYWIGHCA